MRPRPAPYAARANSRKRTRGQTATPNTERSCPAAIHCSVAPRISRHVGAAAPPACRRAAAQGRIVAADRSRGGGGQGPVNDLARDHHLLDLVLIEVLEKSAIGQLLNVGERRLRQIKADYQQHQVNKHPHPRALPRFLLRRWVDLDPAAALARIETPFDGALLSHDVAPRLP